MPCDVVIFGPQVFSPFHNDIAPPSHAMVPVLKTRLQSTASKLLDKKFRAHLSIRTDWHNISNMLAPSSVLALTLRYPLLHPRTI